MLNFKSIANAKQLQDSTRYASGMDIHKARVNALLDLKESAGSQKQLAIFLDVTPGYIGQLLSGHRPITEKNARKIECKLGLPSGWMDREITPHTPAIKEAGAITLPTQIPTTSSGILIQQYTDVSGSMGDGLTLRDQPGQITEWMVTPEWLNKNIPANTGNKNLRIITGFGDSMRGMFNSGDPLIVDIGVKSVGFDAVYFFRVADEGFIKRLQRVPGRGLLAISENKAYEAWPITEDMDFEVFGRVLKVWKSEEF